MRIRRIPSTVLIAKEFAACIREFCAPWKRTG